MCLPSVSLLQHLPSYLGFSYLGRGVSLHSCSSKAQLLLLTLDEGYLLSAALPHLQCGIAPPGHPPPAQPLLLGLLLPATAPDLGHGVAPQGHRPWPRVLPLASDAGWLLSATVPDLGHRVAPPSCRPWPRRWGSSSWKNRKGKTRDLFKKKEIPREDFMQRWAR